MYIFVINPPYWPKKPGTCGGSEKRDHPSGWAETGNQKKQPKQSEQRDGWTNGSTNTKQRCLNQKMVTQPQTAGFSPQDGYTIYHDITPKP